MTLRLRITLALKRFGTRVLLIFFVLLQLGSILALLPPRSAKADIPPTFSDVEASTLNDLALNETTGTLTWSAGDFIVVMGLTENGNITLNTPTATGLTFSLTTSLNVGESGDCVVYVWTASAGSSGSSAVSATGAGGTAMRGIAAYAVSGSQGLGNTATIEGSANKVVNLTRANSNSAVITALGDWNAVNDTAVTATPVGGTVRQAANVSTQATFFLTDWTDQGSAGATNYGITDHTGTVVMSAIAVEIRGAPSPNPTTTMPLASSTSETQQTTTSTTYTASDTSIASSSLPAGTYMVAWGAAVANSNANEITWARLVRGSTVVAELGSEANAASAANNGRSPGGYWLGTLSGSEALTIEYRVTLNTTTGYIDSKFIKAMRLDTTLTADADYWTTGSQEAGTDEITNATTASYSTVKTLTKTFHASSAQNYIVLGSMEISPDNATNDCNAKLVVDGTDVSVQTQEGEDTTDIYGYTVADLVNIGTGSKTITLQGQSVGSATCDFLRSRIYVFRANIFDQVLENESLGESTLASATWTTKTTQAYTPNQSEDVMVITNQQLGSNAAASPAATRINNTTDAVVYGDTRSHAVNNVTPDYYTNMTAASLSVAGAKTFTGQYQRSTGAGTVKIKNARIIVWSMTVKPAALKQSAYRWFNNSLVEAWWDSSWTERRKVTLDNSDSSENLTNFPIRVSLVGSGGGQNIDYAKTQNAGQDIRFVDADGSTVLKHEIETWNESGTSEVWVKVPQINSGSTTDYIWMYYNNGGASDGQDVANVWSNSYTSVWHLKESPVASAPQFNDSAVANDGTANGMVSGDGVSGKIGNAVNFDGTDNEITTATSYNNPQGFTVSAWAKTTSTAGKKIIGLETDGAWDRMLVVDTAGKARFGIYDGGFNIITSTTTVNDDAWRHLAATSNGTSNISLYQNGGLEASASATAAENYTGTWHIGAFRAWTEIGASDGYFTGIIDEVRISSVVRTADWVEAEYISGNNSMNTFASEETYSGGSGFAPLTTQDTAYTLTTANQEFRLRMLLHVSNNFLVAGEQGYKLQFATKSGTCDTGYSGETYADVATGSGAIRFKDNTGLTDGSALSENVNDPTHSADTIRTQSYEESNNFTSLSRISIGEDGKWEFALVDASAPASTSYCFRVIEADGSVISTPDIVPEITTAAGSNTAPGSPSSLAQKKTDDTVISTAGWTNETSIKITATVTDSDGGDTVKICAEVDPLDTAFSSPSGDGDGCSTAGVSSGGTATVTIGGLSNGEDYHWQIKAKDAAGEYSSWVTYGTGVFSAVREFDGTDDDIHTGVGGLSGFTHGTVAAIAKRASGSSGAQTIFATHNSGGTGQLQFVFNAGNLGWWGENSGEFLQTTHVADTEVWYLVVVRKASGNATPRYSVYDYSSDTWSHGNFTGDIVDSTAPGAGGTIRFSYGGIGERLEGRIAARAAWSNDLPWAANGTGDTQIEAAGLETSIDNWSAVSPDALWAFNQAAVGDGVSDLTGNGADETSVTGTTVITNDIPSGFSFGGTPDFSVDTSAPTGGTVYDGSAAGIDTTFSTTSLSSLSANWSGFNFDLAGLQKYEYSIGTTAGATDVRNWTDNSTTTSVTATSLTLQTSQKYFVNVRAYDNAGNTVVRSSDGQLVAPSLSFSVSPSTVTFSNLNAANSYTDTEATTVTTSTNAYGGYVIRAFASDFLRSAQNHTIADFNGGSYASPDTWQSGDTGFGYTSNDTTIQGVNKFQDSTCPGGTALVSPGCYAPFTQTKPGDIIADHTSNVAGSPITDESFTITLRVTTPAAQQAATYQALLVYAITPIY